DTNNQYASTEGFYGANLGNEIATFTVMAGGGGLVDASGSPTTNGQVTVFAKADAGTLDAGYFFRENGDDLSLESVMAFAFTNANTVGAPDDLQVSEIACEFAGYKGAGCNGTDYANGPGNIFLGNNGQFKLAEVPEPGSLALFGIAMLGAGFVSRKRAKKA
ncbi:PEP-CTERM sorting domain-containing protein, partial [Massilia sp. CMS3.1]|uniref:PEP-CTERM sorting domain-containing protein n=1 Tax=Massilia sp. CMS3.1 TaxID=3373083 RepID=UPI003EE48F03